MAAESMRNCRSELCKKHVMYIYTAPLVAVQDLTEARIHGVFANRSAYTSNAVGEGVTTCGAMTFGNLEPKELQVRVFGLLGYILSLSLSLSLSHTHTHTGTHTHTHSHTHTHTQRERETETVTH